MYIYNCMRIPDIHRVPVGIDDVEKSISIMGIFPLQVGSILGNTSPWDFSAFGVSWVYKFGNHLTDEWQKLLDLQQEAFAWSNTAIVRRSKGEIEIFEAHRLWISDGKERLRYTSEEWLEFIPLSHREIYKRALGEVFRGKIEKFDIFYPLVINGETIWVLSEWHISGGFIVGTMKNMTRHIQTYMKSVESSHTDGLTGLLNRSGFIAKLTWSIANDRISDTGNLSILFIDLDGFKEVNDTFWHTYGDSLLQQIGQRLKGALRSEDIVARMGGDEFAIALPWLSEPLYVERIAKKIRQALQGQYSIDGINGGQNFDFQGGSIGIAIFEKGIDNIDVMLSKADEAMYIAKKGSTWIRFYDEELHNKMQRQKYIIESLKLSLEEGIGEGMALYPVYQPIHGPENCLSFEALLRFRTPDGENIPPDVFIPLAEKAGLIIWLGKEMIRAVSKQLRKWQESGRWDIPSIAINVSALQLNGEKLYYDLLEIIEETEVNPRLLTLEITESQTIENKDNVLPLLQKIKSIGIKISIDDFGTGYSSLHAFDKLTEIPLDSMKIDKWFIENLLEDPRKRLSYALLLKWGRNYGIKVVVEWIETEEQLQILKDIGFQYFQGYHLWKPADTRHTENLLDQRG